MNLAFDEVIGADAETRAGLFATTAGRLGTTPQNAEKDFWVCWTLDALGPGRRVTLPARRPPHTPGRSRLASSPLELA